MAKNIRGQFSKGRLPSSSGNRRTARAGVAGLNTVVAGVAVGTDKPDDGAAFHAISDRGINTVIERVQDSRFCAQYQSKKARGTASNKASVEQNDDILRLSAFAYIGDTTGYYECARIEVETDGQPVDAGEYGYVPGKMHLRVAGVQSNGRAIFRRAISMVNDGNVGIDVVDPDQKLEIGGSIHISGEEDLSSTTIADGDGGILYIKTDGKIYYKSSEVSETDLTAGGSDTTYDLLCPSGTTAIRLDPSTGSNDDVTIAAGTGITVTRNSNTQMTIATTITDTNTWRGVTAGGNTLSVSETLAFTAGTGISIAESAGAVTITNTVSDTNTTYSAGNGIALSTTTFSVAGGNGLVQEGSGLALDDPANLSQLTESTDATDDKILLWDESASAWKHMTLDDLQDSIDTGGGDANEYSFKTISVSGQSDVVADADDDTLTLVAGSGVTITTTADQITFVAADTNTFRTVTAGGNTLGAGETLAFTAGTGISIAESAGAVTITNTVSDTNTFRTVTAGGNTLGAGETLAFTAGTGVAIAESAGAVTITNTVSDTNTTYSAGNGIALSTTTFSVAGGAGLVQESSGLALDDPANLSELTESTDATDDKIFLWDESASAWKYMTLDNLQDSIDTGGGGGASLSGTTNNTVATVTGSNALIGEANLTFDGNSLLVVTGSTSAVPCTIKGASSQTADLLQFHDSSGDELLVVDKGGSIKMGLGGDREVHVEPESGTNAAGKDLFLKGGKSTGNAEGGDVRFYTAPAGSSGSSVNNWSEALKIRNDKVVDFKKAGGAKTVTLQNDAMDLYMMGGATVTVNATEWLEIKVNGNTRYIPVWS